MLSDMTTAGGFLAGRLRAARGETMTIEEGWARLRQELPRAAVPSIRTLYRMEESDATAERHIFIAAKLVGYYGQSFVDVAPEFSEVLTPHSPWSVAA